MKKSLTVTILGLLLATLLAGVSPAQQIEGVSTRVSNALTLPVGAPIHTVFILQGAGQTDAIYICDPVSASYCSSSGDWILSSGSGSGCSSCALQTLNNLSGATAINATMYSASGRALTLSGFNGTSGAGATGVIIEGGTAYSSGSSAGPNVVIQGGTAGGSGGNGGQLDLLGGVALAGVGGSVFITAQPGAGTNQNGGSIFVKTGAPTGSGAYGFLSVGLTGASAVGSVTPISGYQPGAYFSLGNGGTPGEVDFASAASANGVVRMTNMNFAWATDNTVDFDLATYRPRDAYFGRNLYVGGNTTIVGSGAFTGGMTVGGAITGNSVSTSGSGPWSVTGSYGTLTTSASGKTKIGFGPLGPQFSFNAGALTYFAYLDSAGVNVVQNANTATKLAAAGTPCSGSFATGVDASGNALCNTAQTIQLPEYSPGCSTITGLSGYWLLCTDTTNGLQFNSNNTGWTQFVHPNLFNSGADTLEMRDLSNFQTLNIYGGTDAGIANYNRLSVTLDGTNSNFNIASQYGGTPPDCGAGACGIEFTIGNSTPKWMIDSSSRFRPYADNAVPIGTSSISPSIITAHQFCIVSSCLTAWPAGASYPAAGVMISTGSGYGTSIAETNNYVLVGVGGAWTAAAITGAMLPNPSASTLGGVESITSAANNWVSYIDTSGVPHQSQPTLASIAAGVAPSGTFDFTSATPVVPTATATDSSTKAASTAFARAVTAADSTADPWITTAHNGNSAVFSSSANKAAFFGIILPFQKTTTQVSYYVGTADTTNTGSNYDLGIYSGTSGGTCTLVAHTGPIAASTSMTANGHTVSWTGGSVTLQPGRYYIAWTSAATSNTAVLYGDSSASSFAGGTSAGSVGNVSISAGGTLGASQTCPTDSVVVAALTPMFQVN
jgi:hypothetical protein